jgi:DNA modification methylase
MKNRFNRLTSKEWLPFQKSWFRYESDEKLLSSNIRFFCKAEIVNDVFAYWGPDTGNAEIICQEQEIIFRNLENVDNENIQFAIFDLRKLIGEISCSEDYNRIKEIIIPLAQKVYERIEYKRFLCVLMPNKQIGNEYFPFAWDMAKALGNIFSLKDEKIACMETTSKNGETNYFQPVKETFYCLYLKKDDFSQGKYIPQDFGLFENNKQNLRPTGFSNAIPSWFILKPQPRKKNEILHPAKYPEELVSMFVNEFTREGDNVLDPMSGTGSTQLGALRNMRNGYGTELSDFFAEIAQERCTGFLTHHNGLFDTGKPLNFKILRKDARHITSDDFPEIDFMLTSPPYWDMLNMKGAENQAKRLKLGLQTNYSDSEKDLGNIADYNEFVSNLTGIYFSIIDILKPGAYITIVVKNIKKKGRNYPFAWDLAAALQEKLILLPEAFWCQDDISIAPYGYGNTWVSNTFHQYCLNFQKRVMFKAEKAWYDDKFIHIILSDRKKVSFPVNLNKKLSNAHTDQLNNIEIICNGTGLNWPALDEDLSILGIMEGRFGNKD